MHKYSNNMNDILATNDTTTNLKGLICEFCEGNDFKEHESGFYVCSDCGVMTKINHSIVLEFNDTHNKAGSKMKYKIGNIEEDDIANETTCISGVNTHLSDFTESECYSKLYNTYCSSKGLDTIADSGSRIINNSNKSNFILKELLCKFQESINKAFVLSINSLKERDININNNNNNNNSKSNIDKITLKLIVKLFKIFWIEILQKELKHNTKTPQEKLSKIFNPRRKSFIRSRGNTEEESETFNNKFITKRKSNNNSNNQIYQAQKSLLEVKNKNRENKKTKVSFVKNLNKIDEYKNSQLTNKLKVDKYLDEYSALQKHLNINNLIINPKLVFSLCQHFKINITEKTTKEEMIHKLFVINELSFDNAYWNHNSDDTLDFNNEDKEVEDTNKGSENTKLNNNLACGLVFFINNVFAKISEYLKRKNNISCSDQDNNIKEEVDYFLLSELEQSFRTFDVLKENSNSSSNRLVLYKNTSNTNISLFDLKILKLNNKEEFIKNLFNFKNNLLIPKLKLFSYNKIATIGRYINLPEDIIFFANKIHSSIESKTTKAINNNHSLNDEEMQISIVLYTLKLFYGLNSLPYLMYLKDSLKGIDADSFTYKLLSQINELKCKDYFSTVVLNSPSFLKIIDYIIYKIKTNKNKVSLWEQEDFKRESSHEYKSNFLKYYRDVWYKNNKNNQVNKKITNLMKLRNEYITKTNSKNSKINNANNNNTFLNINKTQEYETRYLLNSFLNEKNTNDFVSQCTPFAKEEIEFYSSILKRKDISIEKTRVNFPLPIDTFLKLHKKSSKYELVIPQAEALIMILFKDCFKISISNMTKCLNIIEQAVEEKIKSN